MQKLLHDEIECPDCDGSGKLTVPGQTVNCVQCNGYGKLWVRDRTCGAYSDSEIAAFGPLKEST